MEQLQILVAATLFITAWLALFKFKLPSRSKNLPPSPFAFPIIGHLHLLRKPAHRSLLKLSQRYGPFMLLKFGSKPTLVVSSSSAAREVLKTHDLVFASRPRTAFNEILAYKECIGVARYGETWRNAKRICTSELLTTKRVEFFRPIRENEMSALMLELFKASKGKQTVNMTEKLSDFSFNVMTNMLMGKSYCSSACEDAGATEARIFHNMILEIFMVGGDFHIGNYIPWLKWLDLTSISRLKKLHKQMDEFFQKEIDEHRAKYSSHNLKDFIDVMISISEHEQLTDDSMKAMLLDMIAAGIESSARTIEWALAELVQNPKAMIKVQQELDALFKTNQTINESDFDKLKYLYAVVKETLRLHPPAPLLLPHESTQECQISQEGYTIPSKAKLLVNVYAIGRDTSIWENPLEFKPERFLDGHNNVDFRGETFELIPFGAGRRSCPGMNLGLATIYFVLARLLHEFEWQKASEELDMSEELQLLLYLAQPLRLVPVARLKNFAIV